MMIKDFFVNLSFGDLFWPFLQYFLWMGLVLIAIFGVKKSEEIKEIRAKGGLFLLGITLLLMLLVVLYPAFWQAILSSDFRS